MHIRLHKNDLRMAGEWAIRIWERESGCDRKTLEHRKYATILQAQCELAAARALGYAWEPHVREPGHADFRTPIGIPVEVRSTHRRMRYYTPAEGSAAFLGVRPTDRPEWAVLLVEAATVPRAGTIRALRHPRFPSLSFLRALCNLSECAYHLVGWLLARECRRPEYGARSMQEHTHEVPIRRLTPAWLLKKDLDLDNTAPPVAGRVSIEAPHTGVAT